MSPALVSFLFTAGATTWIYTKFQKYNGNDTKSSLIGAAVCAVLIFIIFDYAFGKISS
ncbi:MAG TPA: hypothetical protein VHD84_00900 [Candidatus Saccharimonadales bacterium]|nr:hypothetical protein [Candidatus Saccharimonadales bacterium]